jgi:hypothetical protein
MWSPRISKRSLANRRQLPLRRRHTSRMPTRFEAYDPEVSGPLVQQQYPRLREEESAVLRSYIRETEPDSIERLRTAVPVGEGEVPGEPSSTFERQAKALSQMKIDAVIDRPGRQEIIELKSRATHTAFGQAIVYDLLLGDRDDEPTESRPVVAAFRAHPDFRRVATRLPVQLHLTPNADPSTATERFLHDRMEFDL